MDTLEDVLDRLARLERAFKGENGRPGLADEVKANTKQIAELTVLMKAHMQAVEMDKAVQKAREDANDILMTRLVRYGGVAGAILTIMSLINILVNLKVVTP